MVAAVAGPDSGPPDARAERASQALSALIGNEVDAGGSLPFSRFMELALYAPGLGYYAAGARKFGAGGDFVTAPELGTLFAEGVAEALAPVLRELGPAATWFEIGGGSGAFAEAVLPALAARAALPARYAILEPSADLRQRQQRRLAASLPPTLAARLHWPLTPPEAEWQGVVFANEVLDALPTPRFAIRGGEVFEQHVARSGAGFGFVERPADALLTAAVRHVERQLDAPFADGYTSELLPQLPYWLQAVIGPLQRGALLFADYGYPRREYYAPARREGTLRAFHRHALVEDVLARPGLQDITASVEFTALAEAGVNAGFEFSGYCHQAGFLLGNGVHAAFERLAAGSPDEVARLRLAQQFKRLTLPEEMGERVQLMGFARDVGFDHAFVHGDLAWRL
jgi:SAM-dependent MidA family methyltransferase